MADTSKVEDILDKKIVLTSVTVKLCRKQIFLTVKIVTTQ